MVCRAGDLPALAAKCDLCCLILWEDYVHDYELPDDIDTP